MSQGFLYMFEFVVDDLMITRPNPCAPEEFPTCVEITFRTGIFVSICDRDFGQPPDPCRPKTGKCVIFSLEGPVEENEKMYIHIYKKRNDTCKFLIGVTDLPIKSMFDKATEAFHTENPDLLEQVNEHQARLPDPRSPKPSTLFDDDCFGRKEEFKTTNEVSKRLLPLFNMKGLQTGNLVLIMRLLCSGPSIVSSFSFNKMTSVCNKQSTKSAQSAPSCGQTQPSASGSTACGMSRPDSSCRECTKQDEAKPFNTNCCDKHAHNHPHTNANAHSREEDSDKDCFGKKQKKKVRPSPSQQCPYCRPQQSTNFSFKKTESKSTPSNCQSAQSSGKDCEDECEAAKARALRKLRYLMQKYTAEG